MRSILENYIKEILQEQVFGAQAFVYHGSKASPEVLVKAFSEGTFDPGQGSGAMYGKGVYTVYEENPKLNTFSGTYGEYVYKLKINLYGYVIFDPEVCVKVYGKNMTPLEQMEFLGLNEAIEYLKSWASEEQEKVAMGKIRSTSTLENIFDRIKNFFGVFTTRSGAYAFTSDLALKLSDILSPFVKGIVYTGRRDGPVALAYDSSTVVPVAWSYANGKKPEWNKINVQELRPALSRSASGEFTPGKHNQPPSSPVIKEPNTVYNGSLNYSYAKKDLVLPPGLTVRGNLYIGDSKITKLPENLTVTGELFADRTILESLPESLKANSISLSRSKIKFLPPNLNVEKLEIDGSEIQFLPAGLVVRGTLNMSFTKIKEIPGDAKIGSELKASFSSLETIPNGFSVGKLTLSGCKKIRSLPNDIKVRSLNIDNTNIKSLPPNLNLDSLSIDKNFTNLPNRFTVQRLYAERDSKIRRFPPDFRVTYKVYPESIEKLYLQQGGEYSLRN